MRLNLIITTLLLFFHFSLNFCMANDGDKDKVKLNAKDEENLKKALTANSSEKTACDLTAFKNEKDYLKKKCDEYVKKRKSENYNFLRSSKSFDTKTMEENLSTFNVLLQYAMNVDKPKDTCFDYEISGDSDHQNFKISFAFKRNYLEADATAHLEETAKIGRFFSRFDYFVSQKVKTAKTINSPKSIYIHGFADQESYGPNNDVDYLDINGKKHNYSYLRISKSYGLRDSIIASESIQGFPKISEMEDLKKLLEGKHMVFPKGDPSKLSDPLKSDVSASFCNYISEVEVNEMLALNRAVQTKRAIQKYLTSKSLIPNLKIGNNGSSSCRNLTELSSQKNCAKRRTTVVEATLNSYFVNTAGLSSNATVLGLGQKPGAFFYLNCAYNGSNKNYSRDALLYLLAGPESSAMGLKPTGQWKNIASEIVDRLTTENQSIIDILLKSDPSLTIDKIKKDLEYSANHANSNNGWEQVYPFISFNNYKLSLEQISEILSNKLFRFYTYPYSNDPKLQKKPQGKWNLNLNLLGEIPWSGTSRLATENNTTKDGPSFLYFKQTRMYRDTNCIFTNKYLEIEKAHGKVPTQMIYDLIKNGPINFKGNIYKDIPSNDCLVFPQTLEMTPNCQNKVAGSSNQNINASTPAKIQFPFFSLNKNTASPRELTLEIADSDVVTSYLNFLKNQDKNFTEDLTKEKAIELVNGLLCDKQKGDGFFKPTIDEVQDCK